MRVPTGWILVVLALVAAACESDECLAVTDESAGESVETYYDQNWTERREGSECCVICREGCACGNSCISWSRMCNVGPGCACNAGPSGCAQEGPQ